MDIEVKHETNALFNSMEEVNVNTLEHQMKEEYGDQIFDFWQVKIETNLIIASLLIMTGRRMTMRPLCETNAAPQFACLECSDVVTSLRALSIHRRQMHCEPHKCRLWRAQAAQ